MTSMDLKRSKLVQSREPVMAKNVKRIRETRNEATWKRVLKNDMRTKKQVLLYVQAKPFNFAL